MTKTPFDITHAPTSAHRLWTALNARIQAGAARRQLRRELSPFSIALTGVAPSDTAVAREIRSMLLHDFEHSA